MIIEPGEEPGQAGWMNSKRFLEEEGTLRFCDCCGEIPRKTEDMIPIPLKRCSNCHHAWYHDRKCQKEHYQEHKKECQLWAKTIKNEPRLENYPFVEYHQMDTAAGDSYLYDRARKRWDENSGHYDNEQPWLMNAVLYRDFFLPTCFSQTENGGKKMDVVMDFGCATGTLTNLLRDHATKVISFDISPKMIDRVRSNNWDNVEAIAGILVDLEDPIIRQFREEYAGKIDLIVSTTVLPYIPHRQAKATFLAIRDLLKPGGTGKYCHVDYDKSMPMIKYPNYITQQECETYYKWGQLHKEKLGIKKFEMATQFGTVQSPFLVGVAKKL